MPVRHESTFSQHPELYEWEAKREAEGRARMRTAPRSALLIGLVFAALVFLVTEQADPRARIITVIGSGALIALAFYRWSYDSGWQMVVEAQRALVALETEQNTREMVSLLNRLLDIPKADEPAAAIQEKQAQSSSS
jgi:hypothetical protein